MRLTKIPDMQTEVISRLLEPEKLVWKEFAALHYSRSPDWISTHPHITTRPVDLLGNGVRIIFSTRRVQDPGIRAHGPEPISPSAKQTYGSLLSDMAQVVVKPLFHNLRVLEDQRPLVSRRYFLTAAQLGITAVGDLHRSTSILKPSVQQGLLSALPDTSRHLLQTQQPVTDWTQDPDLSTLIIQRLLQEPVDVAVQTYSYRAHRVMSDDRLTPLDWCLALDSARLQHPDPGDPYYIILRLMAVYLLGPQAASTLDPNLWGIGSFSC